MNILYTSDLHSRQKWYQWILKQAPNYDLICIAGDLLDMFSDKNLLEQLYELYFWCQKMEKTGVPLALCSGNHDFAEKMLEHGDVSQAKQSVLKDEAFVNIFTGEGSYLNRLPGVICADQSNHIFKNQLLISSCPYSFYDERVEGTTRKLLYDAFALKQKHQIPWIILHHDPPEGAGISMAEHHIDSGSTSFGEWVRNLKPDITLSGHLHEAPLVHGSCVDKVGKSFCFNCGHDSTASIPSYVELKLGKNRIDYSWAFKGKAREKKSLKVD